MTSGYSRNHTSKNLFDGIEPFSGAQPSWEGLLKHLSKPENALRWFAQKDKYINIPEDFNDCYEAHRTPGVKYDPMDKTGITHIGRRISNISAMNVQIIDVLTNVADYRGSVSPDGGDVSDYVLIEDENETLMFVRITDELVEANRKAV